MALTRVVMLLSCAFLAGCSSLGYYGQAIGGQLEILCKRQRIDLIIDDPKTDPKLRSALITAQAVRDFAVRELDLPDNNAYKTYAQLDRRYVVWNVLAAPADSVSLKTWCFPIAGCLSYKGFFKEASARALQRELDAQGYDTYVYGVAAYSTLGWFADPVLDTFLHTDEYYLASLIFHELAHQVVYIKDDPEFNEAFATAVEQSGIVRWIRQTGDGSGEAFLERERRHAEITQMILQQRKRLQMIYRFGKDRKVTAEDTAKEKARFFAALKATYQSLSKAGKGTLFYDWWFSLDLNNAHLSSLATYHRWVPSFAAAIERAPSMASFYAEIRELSKLPKPQREAWLKALIADQRSSD